MDVNGSLIWNLELFWDIIPASLQWGRNPILFLEEYLLWLPFGCSSKLAIPTKFDGKY